MSFKNLLILSTLTVTSACGGVTTDLNALAKSAEAYIAAELAEKNAALISLTATTQITADSDAEVVAINYDGGAAGGIVTASNFGGLTTATVTMQAPVGNKNAFTVVGNDAGGGSVASKSVGPNLNLITRAATNVKDASAVFVQEDGVDQSSVLLDDTYDNIYYTHSTQTVGTSEIETQVVRIGDISAVYTQGKVGDDNTYTHSAMKTYAISDRDTSKTTGEFQYEGIAVVTMADGSALDSNVATMTVKFDGSSGSVYSANNTDIYEAEEVVEFTMQSDIVLDNATGKIYGSSGTSGRITVDGVEKNMGLIGHVSADNNAVAGAFIVNGPDTVGHATGGIFVLPKTP